MDSDYVTYRFELTNREIEFRVKTCPVEVSDEKYPAWTKLSYKQCRCCPLKETDCDHCPAATRISGAFEAFADRQSIARAKVTVITSERQYYEECDLQVGINSLVGLMMATSGCPVLKELGAMASFHIPFCSTRETLRRTVSSYLIKQYFKHRKGEPADWDMTRLKELYGELEGLNQDFSRRIETAVTNDALSNAIIMFFATSVVVASSLDEQLARHEDYLTNSPNTPAPPERPSLPLVRSSS